MKSKLLHYSASSPLMNTLIVINGEEFSFNLSTELKIQSADIDADLKRHSRIHAFLGRVHSLLVAEVERAEVNKKRINAMLYLKYKKEIGVGGRPNSDDVCKAKVELSKKYRQAISKYIEVKQQLIEITNAMASFEHRKSLLQTISSNKRNNS